MALLLQAGADLHVGNEVTLVQPVVDGYEKGVMICPVDPYGRCYFSFLLFTLIGGGNCQDAGACGCKS